MHWKTDLMVERSRLKEIKRSRLKKTFFKAYPAPNVPTRRKRRNQKMLKPIDPGLIPLIMDSTVNVVSLI